MNFESSSSNLETIKISIYEKDIIENVKRNHMRMITIHIYQNFLKKHAISPH